MKKFNFLLILLITFSLSISPVIIVELSAQQEALIPPRKQWKETSDIEKLTCKEGLLLMQKNNGAPACVSPLSYLKLVDRNYGMFDPDIMMKRPMMMNNLIEMMSSNQNIMSHWHEMMINDKTMMQKTMDNWITKMKENHGFLANMMGPMMSDPELRKQMIQEMKKHRGMMDTLQEHPRWMDSVHHERLGSEMGSGMGMDSHGKAMHMDNCPWCPEYDMHQKHQNSSSFSHNDRMMNMMHQMWINEEITTDMHEFMIKNPSHMSQMSDQMMGQMLGPIMDDPELRQQMIDLMLEHQEFMNSIRHEN